MSVELELGNTINKQPIYHSILRHLKKKSNRDNQSLTSAFVPSTSNRSQYELHHHQGNCTSFVKFEPTTISEPGLQ